MHDVAPVNDVATVGCHAAPCLHRSHQDLATYRSRCGNLTDAFSPGQHNVNPVTSNAMSSGIVSSVRNVVQHQIPSTSFPSSSSYASSMSEGVVYDAFPLLATALAPLPALSHSQSSICHSEIPVTATKALKQREPNRYVSSLTTVRDQGSLHPVPAQAAEAILTNAKQSFSADSNAFDVYEFRDEDDCALAGLGVSFRQGMPSRSTASNPLSTPRYQSVNSQPMCVRDLSGERRLETESGLASSQQNVAMIFDMDSKSICRVSLPIKAEPHFEESRFGSVPLRGVGSTSVHIARPAGCMSLQNSAVPVASGKHHLPREDVQQKRIRLNSSYPAFENVGTNSYFVNIPDVISTARNVSNCDGSLTTFDRWHANRGLLQPANTLEEQESAVLRNVTCPDEKVSYKLTDVAAVSQLTATACSQLLPSSYQLLAAPQPARSPARIVTNGAYQIRASKQVSSSPYTTTYADRDCHRYGFHLQTSMPVKLEPVSRQEDRSKRVAMTDHSNAAVLCNSIEQNTSRSALVEGSKQFDSAGVNSQYGALSRVLDLSHKNAQMSPSTSVISCSQSFHRGLQPTAAAGRNSSSHIQRTFSDSSLPQLALNHDSHSYHLQQQLALSIKKENIIEENKSMITDAEEKLMNRLKCNLIEEAPHCHCRGLRHSINNPSSVNFFNSCADIAFL